MNFNKNLCYNELDKIVFAQIIFWGGEHGK